MIGKRISKSAGALVLAALAASSVVTAQSTSDALAEYREMMGDDNPAEFSVMRGEELWTTARGPNNVSLEQCDLGSGPGVTKGAYASLPRYFKDAGRVMDLETRLLHCMETLQGIAREDALKQRFGDGAKQSDFEALAAFIAEDSRGMKLSVPLRNKHERKAFALGEQIFFYRAGTHDFSCATCHAQSGLRIRLQDLPNLTDPADAQKAYAGWPAYRISQGEVRTMQWRMRDCLRQQRFPELGFGSEASVALITYLAHQADGATMEAPGLKR